MTDQTVLVVGEGSVATLTAQSLSDQYRVRTAPTRDDIDDADGVRLVVLTPSVATDGRPSGEVHRKCDCPVVAVCEDDTEFDVDHCLRESLTEEGVRSFVDEVLAYTELGTKADTCYELAERMAELRARHSTDELSTDAEFAELRRRLADEHTQFADRLEHVPADKAFPATLDDDGEETANETA